MGLRREREVVLEIEHIRLVRKRATTRVLFCGACDKAADFCKLIAIAELFGITPSELFSFANSNKCHFLVEPDGEIYICLAHLLMVMNRKKERGTVKLIGD